MDFVIKLIFTGKTPWQMVLTISTLLFYVMITPICSAILIVGLFIWGKRWAELVGIFNNQPIIKRLANLVVPAV
jgi:hypothetical protein